MFAEYFYSSVIHLNHFSLLLFFLPTTSPSGPVCSACVDNFGARPVTIFSGVMVAGGLMLSAFAPNVQFLIFSYGIVVGKETLDDFGRWGGGVFTQPADL